MGKRHYDSKEEILKRMREVDKVQKRADKAVAASWTVFMMIGLLTLYEDLGFRDKRLNGFIDGMQKRNAEYDDGNLSLEEIKKRLYENAGVVVEMPDTE